MGWDSYRKDTRNNRLWKVWKGIKKRCYQKGHSNYKKYGAKGIRMCDEWKTSSIAFRNWSLNHGYEPGLTIDRIDPCGHYCPENCRWLPFSENLARSDRGKGNKRGPRFPGTVNSPGRPPTKTLTAWGETKLYREWEADPRCSVDRELILSRTGKGWPPEKAVSEPRRVVG